MCEWFKTDSQYDLSPAFRPVSVFVFLLDFISFHRPVHNSLSQLTRNSQSNNHV